jgi:hypothetical protein
VSLAKKVAKLLVSFLRAVVSYSKVEELSPQSKVLTCSRNFTDPQASAANSGWDETRVSTTVKYGRKDPTSHSMTSAALPARDRRERFMCDLHMLSTSLSNSSGELHCFMKACSSAVRLSKKSLFARRNAAKADVLVSVTLTIVSTGSEAIGADR